MFEKVNPAHPDKIADRISGAVVDLCYTKSHDPKVACEVLIGHGQCNVQVETSEQISADDIAAIVRRIAGDGIETRALIVPQDPHLAANQQQGLRAGDNGIFRGVPPTHEQKLLTAICSIGDEDVTFQYASGKTETMPFRDVVEQARLYILTDCNGSFERFAMWGLIRPQDV